MVGKPFDTSMLIRDVSRDPDFPEAPIEWAREAAQETAKQEGLTLTDEPCLSG